MKIYRLKSAKALLVVFLAILLSGVYQPRDFQIEETEEITVIHKNEYSGEAPGNVSRSFIDHTGFESRIFQDFAFNALEDFHTQLSHTGYTQVNLNLVQFKAPIKVYKLFQKFLI